jgi:hypothetical protein
MPGAMTEFRRRYMTAALPWAMGVAYLVILGAVVLLAAEGAALVYSGIAIIGGGFAVWSGVDIYRNGGLRETPEGITCRQLLVRYRRWRWADIEKLATFNHAYM